MDLEGIMLSKVPQTDKDNYHMISLICGIEKKKKKQKKIQVIHRENILVVARGWSVWWENG